MYYIFFALVCFVQLLSVNRNWDEHCRQQELNHSQQVNALNVKLSEAQSRLNNYERSDQQRQLEIDNIVLTAKKQREAEEVSKNINSCSACVPVARKQLKSVFIEKSGVCLSV